MTPLDLLALVLSSGIGLVLGLAHFDGLRRDTRRYLARGMSPGAVAAHAGRLLATAAVLVLVARSGAIPLVAALAGFLVARFVAVTRAERPA
jgi:F1F0 ATPase subunit 2